MTNVGAILAEEKWYQEFFDSYKGDEHDRLYAEEMKRNDHRRVQKKIGLTIAEQIHVNPFRILYWVRHKRKYNLDSQTLVFAFIQSFKK